MSRESINTSLFSDLPIVYANLFPDFFRNEVPQESLATCNNCSMVCRDSNKDTSKLAMRPFQADKKCCTYHPSLPSYLVGGALLEASQEGATRLKEAIDKKIGVTPFGLNTPGIYNLLYKNQIGGFGNSETLRCPYYLKESGNCSIWKFRESVCSTYFCKHISGVTGQKFWMLLKEYLQHAEENLVLYLAREAKLDYFLNTTRAFKSHTTKLTVQDLDGLPREGYDKLWGEWSGKEVEFYKWAYQKVQAMSKNTFNEITGIQQKVLLDKLKSQRDEMLDIPDHLKVHPDWQPQAEEENKLIHFKAIDVQFELPTAVLEALDGKKPLSAALQDLNEKEGIELDESLILSLYHHGVLEKQQ